MPAPYPQEFREDVVRVARSREAGITLAQIAKDFGVHEMTLHKWIRLMRCGELPSVKLGRSRLIKAADLLAYVENLEPAPVVARAARTGKAASTVARTAGGRALPTSSRRRARASARPSTGRHGKRPTTSSPHSRRSPARASRPLPAD